MLFSFQLLPTHHKDLYSDMRETARSIQAADDPERLFGERPQRRRYRTGERIRSSAVVGGGGGVTPVAVVIPERC